MLNNLVVDQIACLVGENDIAARILEKITVGHLLGGRGEQVPGDAHHPQQDRGDRDWPIALMHGKIPLCRFVEPDTLRDRDWRSTLFPSREGRGGTAIELRSFSIHERSYPNGHGGDCHGP